MKITKEKITGFLSGKGFYLVLAASMLAVGIASFIAFLEYNDIKEPVLELSSNLSSESKEESSSDVLAGTDTKEPYSSKEESSSYETSSEEEIALDIIADKFTMPKGSVAKEFSLEELKYSKTYKDMRIHAATDLSAEKGSSVLSMGKGIVTAVTVDSELGVSVEIDHGNGIIAYYCGLNETLNVSEGTLVSEETVLGTLGEIPGECEDESHLHLEVFKDGKPIDPLSLIN